MQSVGVADDLEHVMDVPTKSISSDQAVAINILFEKSKEMERVLNLINEKLEKQELINKKLEKLELVNEKLDKLFHNRF